jgi:hypothetical protein
MAPRSVAVLVLGDVGRSPRMQYHTTSLAALPDTDVSVRGVHARADDGPSCVRSVGQRAPTHRPHPRAPPPR